jgi:hypothetical protein
MERYTPPEQNVGSDLDTNLGKLKEIAENNLARILDRSFFDRKSSRTGMPLYNFSVDPDNPDDICVVYVYGLSEYGNDPEEIIDTGYDFLEGQISVQLDHEGKIQTESSNFKDQNLANELSDKIKTSLS